jgi:hypothetical protein
MRHPRIKTAEIILNGNLGVPEASDGAPDNDGEPWAPKPATQTDNAWYQISPMPELSLTVTPDTGAPRSDKRTLVAPKTGRNCTAGEQPQK